MKTIIKIGDKAPFLLKGEYTTGLLQLDDDEGNIAIKRDGRTYWCKLNSADVWVAEYEVFDYEGEGEDSNGDSELKPIHNIEFIAKMCHEANRQLCLDNGDTSYVAWEETPDWQRKPLLNGVEYHLLNPQVTARDSFENWKAGKLADGWKYGATKNPDTKEHPCIVDYDQLSAFDKAKDVVIVNMVNALRPLF